MAYPLEESKTPLKTRLLLNDCIQFTNFGTQTMFPDIISGDKAFIAGCNKENWTDLFERMLIFCSISRINIMFFGWDGVFFSYVVMDWRSYFPPIREDFHEYLVNKYNIGGDIPLIETPSKSIESFAIFDKAMQIFVSPPTKDKNFTISTTIPPISASNPSIVGLIEYKKLKVYCHASLGVNLGNPGYNGYIGNLLSYCSAHGMLGVVFHCPKMSKRSKEEAIIAFRDNIILGVRSQKNLYSKLLIETPAGQTNEIFSDACEFFTFIHELKSIPDISHLIGVCVDLCHVFAAGYCPYAYLNEACKHVNVELVHFNDSLNEFGSHVDRHARLGTGYAPYPILEKCAHFCMINNISMVLEC